MTYPDQQPSSGWDRAPAEPGLQPQTGYPGQAPDPARVADDRSLGEIMSDLTANVSLLMRQEVALAKAEIQDSAKKAGKGAGLFTGAGVAGHMALLFGSLALWWGIALLLGNALNGAPAFGWSFLIVTVLWAVIALILAKSGQSEFQKIDGLQQTTETVGQIPNALKGDEEKNR